jgi:acyl-[acyl-carrier-protein] desaturase
MDQENKRLVDALPENARGLPDEVRVSVALNLLTEEGLPHFHRLLSTYLGPDSMYARWNRLWTAEEDRHGGVIRDYTRAARIFNSKELDKLQYSYIEAGFNPDWRGDPYRLLAYTSLQERATQWAHAKTARLAGKYEPILRNLLGHVAGDESRHHAFYRDVFKGLLDLDPNQALHSLLKIMPSLQMPGHTISEYDAMASVVHRTGIYGPWQYKQIVEELLDYWQIANMVHLNGIGHKAQAALMALPARLKRFAERMDRRYKQNTYKFAFLYNRPITC